MQASVHGGIKRVLNTVIHRSASVAARVPLLQGPIFAAYARLFPDGPWMRTHPFDRQFATDTSGLLPTWLLRSGLSSNRQGVCYAGCHPTRGRAALDAIPDLAGSSFLDLGCGKGRAMIVASEYRPGRIIGVELSAELAKVANRNPKVIASAYPQRGRDRGQPAPRQPGGVQLPRLRPDAGRAHRPPPRRPGGQLRTGGVLHLREPGAFRRAGRPARVHALVRPRDAVRPGGTRLLRR